MPVAKQPLVSIVIPSYNGMPYLEAAIESVLTQTYSNIELIVLDDGSTDSTVEFLQRYKGRFHFESHPNMGQARTLNKGWAMAKGDVLSYLSADDLLLPKAVDVSIEHLHANPDVVLSYPDNNLIDQESRLIRIFHTPEYDYYDMVENLICPVAVGGFFLRSAFDKLGGWDATYSQMPDYEFWLRLAKEGDFLHIPQILGSHRIHEASFSFRKISVSRADEMKNLMTSLLNATDDKTLQQHKNAILGRAYLISARNHWRSGRYKIALKYALVSVKLAPQLLLWARTYRLVVNALLNRQGHCFLRIVRNLIGMESH